MTADRSLISRPQTFTFSKMARRRRSRRSSGSIPVRVALAGAGTSAVVAHDVASNERAGESRVFVLVLDAIHVASPRTRVVRAYARQFIERHVGPADLVAVVSPGGLTAATQDFTSDKARLLAAVDHFAGDKLASATVEIDRENRASSSHCTTEWTRATASAPTAPNR